MKLAFSKNKFAQPVAAIIFGFNSPGMKEKLFRKLLLFARSKQHRTKAMLDCFAEVVNDTNRIFLRVLDHLNIEARYNTADDTVVQIVSMPAVYSFLDELLGRTSARRVEVQPGELIGLPEWKEELGPVFRNIRAEKDYDQYLMVLDAETQRFRVQYVDYIVIIRDKEKALLTNVVDLDAAILACK